MKIKVISTNGKMYTLPDKILAKEPNKPKEMINDEKAQFLEDVKNAKVIRLSDGVNNGLIKIPITEENMNRIVLTTDLNHAFQKDYDGKTPVKCRAYTIIPKGATKKIEFTLKQDGDIPFGLYISSSGFIFGDTKYLKYSYETYTNINGFLLSIPNTTAYEKDSEGRNLTRAHIIQRPLEGSSGGKYLYLDTLGELGKKSFIPPHPYGDNTIPYGNYWFTLSECLDFLGGEKFKTEGCRLILEEVKNSLILTNKETNLSLMYIRRDDEEIRDFGFDTEMLTFDFLFISRLLVDANGATQSSAIIEDLKYIN